MALRDLLCALEIVFFDRNFFRFMSHIAGNLRLYRNGGYQVERFAAPTILKKKLHRSAYDVRITLPALNGVEVKTDGDLFLCLYLFFYLSLFLPPRCFASARSPDLPAPDPPT